MIDLGEGRCKQPGAGMSGGAPHNEDGKGEKKWLTYCPAHVARDAV